MKNVKYWYRYVRKEIAFRSLLKPDKEGSDLTLLGRKFHFLDAK